MGREQGFDRLRIDAVLLGHDTCRQTVGRVMRQHRHDGLGQDGPIVEFGRHHVHRRPGHTAPGIDRPLTRAKDFANWAGHEVRIVMDKGFDGQRVLKGDLKGIDGDDVTIADRKSGDVTVPRSQIHSAQLVLTDALIAATKPLDTSGAEEEVLEAEED